MSVFWEGLSTGHHEGRPLLQLSQSLASLVQSDAGSGQLTHCATCGHPHALHAALAWDVLGQAPRSLPCCRLTDCTQEGVIRWLKTWDLQLINCLSLKEKWTQTRSHTDYRTEMDKNTDAFQTAAHSSDYIPLFTWVVQHQKPNKWVYLRWLFEISKCSISTCSCTRWTCDK